MKYKNPPITEALIDIRVKLPDYFSVDSFVGVEAEVKERFPVKRAVSEQSGEVIFQKEGTGVEFKSNSKCLGFLFENSTRTEVLQCRLNGFTFSRLRPYTDWESFSEKALGLWGAYKRVAKPEVVTRLAVRFINRLDLPAPKDAVEKLVDIEQYLNIYPFFPDGFDQNLLNYYFRAETSKPGDDAKVVIQQARIQSPEPENYISILLDIDAFKDVDEAPDDDSFWKHLSGLRNLKNEVFESSIKDKMRGLFE